MTSIERWDAFCTVFWFATGYEIVEHGLDAGYYDIYDWFLSLERKS